MPGLVVPFVEVIAGGSAPAASAEYTAVVEATGIVGVRAGMRTPTLAVDVGAEWHRARTDTLADFSVDFDRARVMLGARAGLVLSNRPRTYVFGRIAAGVDIADERRISFLEDGESFQGRDYGVALDVALGVAVDVGPLALGVQLVVPIAIDAGRNADIDFEYTSVDLAALATVSIDLE